ncbi:DNA topoisomerase 3 [Halomonas sp. I5-271120]|uniref:DNA topoisomerase 3 n=1 Tax=Halomonas sp. I5-271120 TaxID=3061632 RepID=UPI0027146A37|nr:DNA topoisomerase 3 [Halomonas sp. I5-271120]
MNLYLCEKPSQGRDLARVLGATKSGEGYLHDGRGTQITWAFGHLLEEASPEDYDKDLKAWKLETLPIVPDKWKKKVSQRGAKQFKVVKDLLSKADTCVISTDFDREGEAIARSIIERVSFKGAVKRLKLRALDEKSIRKALQEICPGEETISLYYASKARSRADWLIGMNLTRAYSLLGRQAKIKGVFSVGRVQTPTVKLVIDRDKAIGNFTPSPYYILKATFEVQNGKLQATWQPPEQVSDEHGRCINKVIGEQFADALPGKKAEVVKAEVKKGKESPPLPFSLSKLQQHCSRKFSMSAKQVLTIAQSLYETRKATSYPRTDCGYLPTSQHAEASDVLRALALSDPSCEGLVSGADITIRSRAFNDKKVSAHHGIIPTAAEVDVSAMSEDERKVYGEIRRHYIAQFYSQHEFEQTEIELRCANQPFTAKGRVPLKAGWKVLFSNDDDDRGEEDAAEKEDDQQHSLPKVRQGEPGQCREADIDSKMTRPPPHFTDATLIGAMKNIARFVSDDAFKKILRSTAGLGTEATRADIIDGCVQKGYLKHTKGTIVSTDKATALLALVPDTVASPAMTAGWEQKLEAIATGKEQMGPFVQYISEWTAEIVTGVKSDTSNIIARAKPYLESLEETTYPCPECGSNMYRLRSKARKATADRPARKAGHFWGCENRDCGTTRPDADGKPGEKRSAPPKQQGPDCPKCGKAMFMKNSTKARKGGSSQFWGCSGWPDCKSTLPVGEEKSQGGT